MNTRFYLRSQCTFASRHYSEAYAMGMRHVYAKGGSFILRLQESGYYDLFRLTDNKCWKPFFEMSEDEEIQARDNYIR